MAKRKPSKHQRNKSKSRKLTNTDRGIAYEMYLSGESISDISGHLNVLPKSIRALFENSSKEAHKAWKPYEQPIGSMSKRTEAFTEYELLYPSSPFYGSSKYKSNQKLIKGWELFTYID